MSWGRSHSERSGHDGASCWGKEPESNEGSPLNGVTYGNGTFVAVGVD